MHERDTCISSSRPTRKSSRVGISSVPLSGKLPWRSQSAGVRTSTHIANLLSYESKIKAARLVCESVPSLHPEHVQRNLLRSTGPGKVHAWGLFSKGNEDFLISVVVFRRHAKLELIEMLYIATRDEFRGDGFGKYLLDQMTCHWRTTGCAYVLVHADFSAVGFFNKASFSAHIPFPRVLFDAWIDRYSSAVLLCLNLVGVGCESSLIPSLRRVSILVQSENTDKCPDETWVDAYLVAECDSLAIVQYAFHQRLYCETLSVASVRLQEV
jgi:GNAT superfamily N-acetyltransferase